MAPSGINSNEMLCLLLNAFNKAFNRKKSKYRNFTNYLEYTLDRYNRSAGVTSKPMYKKKRKAKQNQTKVAKKAKMND